MSFLDLERLPGWGGKSSDFPVPLNGMIKKQDQQGWQ
jgi:hypothetical protein